MTNAVYIFRFFDPFDVQASSRNTVAATTSGTDRVALSGNGESLEIVNEGTDTVFVNLGTSISVTATSGGSVTAAATGGYAVGPGQVKVIYCGPSITYAAVVSASGTQVTRLTRGNGM